MGIKLIASDIDGTLLINRAPAIPSVIFEEIRRLREKGILFCPASGRQYGSLKRLFAPVAEECMFLCENGAIVYGSGSVVLSKTVMPRDLAVELAEDIILADGCDAMLSGANMTYICSSDEQLIHDLRYFVGNNLTVVQRPQDVPEDIIKVSAYCRQGAAVYEQQVSPKWKELFSVAVAGPPWLDFTLANKGTGLRDLCRVLGIAREEVMAFGDNFNDIAMLDFAGHPYLMEGAAPALKERYPNHCANVADVLKTL